MLLLTERVYPYITTLLTCPEHLLKSAHCHVTDYYDGRLCISANNLTLINQLKYASPYLIQMLQANEPDLHDLNMLKIISSPSIQSQHSTIAAVKPAPNPSNKTLETITLTAAVCQRDSQDTKLSKSLAKLRASLSKQT